MKNIPQIIQEAAAVGLLLSVASALGAAPVSAPGEASREAPFANTLGMEFVPAPPGSSVLFSVWETRVGDYDAFRRENGRRSWSGASTGPGDHPVVNVTWDEANAFCQWLTGLERERGGLTMDWEYRLPTDLEWSRANGLDEDLTSVGHTPAERNGRVTGWYGWGHDWPPPPNVGAFVRSYARPDWAKISPVGAFSPNEFGIHDLAGNVAEWCGDKFNPDRVDMTVRGTAWSDPESQLLHEVSRRSAELPSHRSVRVGFRCVLAPTGNVRDPGESGVWRNSLGMPFVAAGKKGLFWSVHETRWKDFLAFRKAQGKVGATRYESNLLGEKPAGNMDWSEANAFCEWLTARDIAQGKIGPDARYRLPTSDEWGAVFETRFVKARTAASAGAAQRNKLGLIETGSNFLEWMQDGPAGSDNARSVRAGICFAPVPAGKPEIPVQPQIAPPPDIPDPPALPSRRRSSDAVPLTGTPIDFLLLPLVFKGPPSYRDQVRAFPYRMRNWEKNNYYNQRNWRLQHEPAIRQWKKDRDLAIREWREEWERKYSEVTKQMKEELSDFSLAAETRHEKIGFRCVLDVGGRGLAAVR